MEAKDYFSKACLCKLLLPVFDDRRPSSFPNGGTFLKGKFISCFEAVRGGQRTLPASVDFQLPSPQNNFYAKVAYLGVAYSDPLQGTERKNTCSGLLRQ